MDDKLIVDINGLDYDFNVYMDYEDIGGYFGFIDPNGGFYRVRDLDDEPSNRPHNTWAREFIKFHNLSYDKEIGTASTALVKKYGYVLYTCHQECDHFVQELFILPDCDGIYKADRCETLCSNTKQLQTIRNIIQSNLENETNYNRIK